MQYWIGITDDEWNRFLQPSQPNVRHRCRRSMAAGVAVLVFTDGCDDLDHTATRWQ